MSNFIDTNINQTVLLDINYLDQLGKDNFDFFVYTLLNDEHMLDEFLLNYHNQKVGRKAYPPVLLLRLIFCAYFRGITSNRVIASLCTTDLKFMALAVGTKRTRHRNEQDTETNKTPTLNFIFCIWQEIYSRGCLINVSLT